MNLSFKNKFTNNVYMKILKSSTDMISAFVIWINTLHNVTKVYLCVQAKIHLDAPKICFIAF